MPGHFLTPGNHPTTHIQGRASKVQSRILAASRTPWIKLRELDVTAAAVSPREHMYPLSPWATA